MSAVTISVIIATRNRESILRKTLGKAVEAIEGKNVEIIVVNDGDKELSVPDIFSEKIICIKNFNRGVCYARNMGASHSRGAILFFIDDDMWINGEIIDWINEQLLQNKQSDAVYNINWEYPPSLERELRNNKIGKYILSSGYNTMWGRMNEKGEKPESGLYKFNAIASCSLVLSKELFNKIGRYNESISFQGEDIDLANRINQLSIPVYCVFETTLYHNHEDRLDLNGFLDRAKKGYYSQYIAEKEGHIPLSDNNYKKPNIYMYNAFLFSEKIWISLYKSLPNNKLLEPFVNKLIGLLSGLEKYKQWKNVFSKSDHSFQK
ncbi:MAG: glycosyltransferase family 2 protein [Ginsengibacter sp.]